METDNYIQEGYVVQRFNEKKQKELVGLTSTGIMALCLLEKLDSSKSNTSFDITKSPIEEVEYVGKKLVSRGYVDHRVDKVTKEEQVCISDKGKEMLFSLSYFVKEK